MAVARTRVVARGGGVRSSSLENAWEPTSMASDMDQCCGKI